MIIQVFDLRPPAEPSSKKSLTLSMIENDGYGGNLNGLYSLSNIQTILHKTEEYNRLTGESNNPRKLIFKYRTKKLGLAKSIYLTVRESSYRALCSIVKKIESDPFLT